MNTISAPAKPERTSDECSSESGGRLPVVPAFDASAARDNHRGVKTVPANRAILDQIRRTIPVLNRGSFLSLLWLLAIGYWLLSSSAALASTVTGKIVDITGTGISAAKVAFIPMSNPQFDGGNFITSSKKEVSTDSSGNFSLTLEQGDYRVQVQGKDQFLISVPNDASSYSIQNLSTSQLTYVYTTPPSATFPVATAIQNGGVKTDVTVASPVVYITTTVDTLLATKQATVTGAASTITSSDLTASRALISNGSGKVAVSSTVSDTELGYLDGVTSGLQLQLDAKLATTNGTAQGLTLGGTTTVSAMSANRAAYFGASKELASSTTTSTELGYLSGVTSAVQTQIDSKQATITGGATTITSSDLTASRALISNGSGKVAVSSTVSDTELGYLDGVTSALQTQLDAKLATTNGTAQGLTLSGSTTNSAVTASRAAIFDGSKVLTHSATTSTELGYVSGVTSAIQTQIDGKQATITGGATTITGSNLTANRALVSDGSGKVAVSSTVSDTELGYLDGVTSALQTQIDAKLATTNGTAQGLTLSGSTTNSAATASRAAIFDGSKVLTHSATTSTELGYVSGVTSAIQTQIDGKQATITGGATTITGSNLTANRALVSDGSGKVAVSSTVSDTELGYLDGVTSALQTQIDAKLATTNGTAQGLTLSGSTTNSAATASRAAIFDGSKVLTHSATTSTELGYVSGVTSAIQTQIDGKQSTITGAATTVTGSDLTANRVVISNGSGKLATGNLSYDGNAFTQTFSGVGTVWKITDGTYGWYVDEGNTLNASRDHDTDEVAWINYHGYNGGTTRFRGLIIGDGKTAAVARFDGAASKLTTLYGALEFSQIASGGTVSSDSARIYAKDNGGTAEIFVKDEAGNETQISPHAMDGPAWLYDTDDPFPRVVKESNHFVGQVRYINESRRAKLFQDMLNGVDLSALDADKKKVTFTETFADHNTRLGLTGDDALTVVTWTAVQSELQTKYDNARLQELTAYTNAVQIAAAQNATNAVKITVQMISDSSQMGDEAGTRKVYVRPVHDLRKPVPTWLQTRLAK